MAHWPTPHSGPEPPRQPMVPGHGERAAWLKGPWPLPIEPKASLAASRVGGPPPHGSSLPGHTIQLGCGICLAVGSALGPVAVPSLASNPFPPFGVREAPTFASPSRASWCFALSLFVRFGRLRHTATLQDSVLA